MSELNLPPFYVGQKVVALENRKNTFGDEIKKGEEFVVLGHLQCSNCKCWYVDIGIRNIPNNGYCVCKNFITKSEIVYVIYKILAPIEETFHHISLSEVLEEESKLVSAN